MGLGPQDGAIEKCLKIRQRRFLIAINSGQALLAKSQRKLKLALLYYSIFTCYMVQIHGEIMLLIQHLLCREEVFFLGWIQRIGRESWGVDIIPGTDKQTPFAKPSV